MQLRVTRWIYIVFMYDTHVNSNENRIKFRQTMSLLGKGKQDQNAECSTEGKPVEIGAGFQHSLWKSRRRLAERRPGFKGSGSLCFRKGTWTVYRGVRNVCIASPESAVIWLRFFSDWLACGFVDSAAGSVLRGNSWREECSIFSAILT